MCPHETLNDSIRVNVKPFRKNQASRIWWAVHAFRAVAFAFARAKHFVCFVYFSAMSILYLTTAPHELRVVDAYAPKFVGIGVLCIGALHFYGLVQTCFSPTSTQLKWLGSWTKYFLHPRLINSAKLVSQTSASSGLTLFHLVDVISQSYQAYRMSFYLTDRYESFFFAFVVSLYCLVTPWFMFARHEFIRQNLVILVDSYLGFFTSTAFPLVVFVTQAFRLLLVDRKLQDDEKLVTVSLLIGRYIVVTSPLDLITKFTIQVSSYLSLRRLVASMQTLNNSKKSNQFTRRLTHQPSFVHETFSLEFKSRRYLILYLIVNFLWGMSMITSATYANWFRDVCPAYCPVDTAPWFDWRCHCAYVEINCAMSEFNGANVEELINPGAIGKSVFFLDIRRCALTHGISLSLLSQFDRLYGIVIAYSNITNWTQDHGETFPDSLTVFNIYGSNIETIPSAFHSLPPGLAFLRLQDSNITAIPDLFFTSWKGIYSLALVRLSLSRVPMPIATMTNLVMLELRGNQISNVPIEWQDQLATSSPNLYLVDVSSNKLEHGLWKLASTKRVLELSSNPITTLPMEIDTGLITSRNIILDDTPLCNLVSCESKCNADCLSRLIGNHRCDLECYTAECNFDDGDCIGWGF